MASPCEDPSTIQDLIQLGLVQRKLNEPIENDVIALKVLRRCANRTVFDIIKKLCESPAPEERAFAADVLGQFGVITQAGLERMFREEVVQALLELLAEEQVPEVLNSIGVAFGHLKEPRAIPLLIRYKNHPNPLAREGVTWGMMGLDDEIAIQTLIELSQDEETYIRDWATFELGSQTEVDTPALREALYRNIHDSDVDVRNEALAGLAMRRDKRVIPMILDLMQSSEDMMSYQFREFCEMLQALQNEIDDPRLAQLLAECT